MKKIVLGVVFAVGFFYSAQAQMITTIAGNGATGLAGDGGAATAAQFVQPFGISRDGAGNLYIADGNRVRKIDPSGIITTIAGTNVGGYNGDGGPATTENLNGVAFVTLDGLGNVYIADGGNHRIRKVDLSGVMTTVAGNGFPGYFGEGIAATAAELNHPAGVGIDATGNLYIADWYNERIRKVDPSGFITTIAGTGSAGYSGDGTPATAATFGSPQCLAIDGAGIIYVSDQSNNAVRKIDLTGIITTVAGTGTAGYSGDGIPATASELYHPAGIALDGVGNLFISDNLNFRIRKVNASGVISTIAGNGINGYNGNDSCAATDAELSTIDVAVDGAGAVYISDNGNKRIRKIIPDHAPSFTGGHTLSITVCEDSVKQLNTLLAVSDIDTRQTETWSVLTPAAHGTAAAAYSATSTGGTLTPTGLSYTPATGYTGSDTFKVVVNDCANGSDTTTIYVTVANCALASPLAPLDKLMMTVQPNPSDGSFTFSLSSNINEPVQIVITNIVGEKVKELTAPTNKTTAIKLNAPAGVYFLSASTTHGRWGEKIVVVK